MQKYDRSQLMNAVLGIPNFLQISYTKWPSNKETHFIQIFYLMFADVSCAVVEIMVKYFFIDVFEIIVNTVYILYSHLLEGAIR